MKTLKFLLAITFLFGCGAENPTWKDTESPACAKMLPEAKWGVYPSKILSGTCGYLPSFWIYTDAQGNIDMTGNDCEMTHQYASEEECREFTNFSCSHPDRNLNASFNYSLVRTEGLEKSIQYNGTLLIGIVDWDMQMMCEALYEVRVIHHPNGVDDRWRWRKKS